jgi:hypothetical protein
LVDEDHCKYVSIRILAQKADFAHQTIKVQVLDLVIGGPPHERLVSLTKIDILEEKSIMIPIKQRLKSVQFNSIPLDLSKLLIKRYDDNTYTIHYPTAEVEIDPAGKEVKKIYNLYQHSKGNRSQSLQKGGGAL